MEAKESRGIVSTMGSKNTKALPKCRFRG
uniref:Uncharacterized protein n=1 Tax=Heterorhabditis bacteriophora TaxID=37862 RepID=A0A1I7WYA1_HETBA